jgi:hypothetical protein
MASCYAEACHDGRGTTAKPSRPLSREDHWLTLRSIAIVDLGLTNEEFWDTNPRMFDALLKRHERKKEDQEFLFGQLASVYVNYSASAPKKAQSPADFMPSEMLKRYWRKLRGPSKEERLVIDAQARALFAEIVKRRKEGESGETQVHHS